MLEILCDMGRGLAALWVFAFHIRPLNTGLWGAAAVGDLGVPVFFVISGFCILSAAQNSRTKDQPALAFLKRRLLRIYPPFWASIVVVMCIPFVLSLLTLTKSHLWVPPNPRWYAYTWKDWVLTVSLCRVFCANGQPLSTAFNGLNAVYWSLAIEVQFYCVMFVALFWRRYFRGILIVVSVLGFGAMFIPVLRDSGLFLAYWPMFSIGIGLKWVLSKPAPKFWWIGLPLAVVLSSCVAAGYARHWLHLSTILYYYCFSVACALVFWMAVPIDRLLRSYKDRNPLRALVFLGAMSYSLYLLHAIVSEVSTAFLRQVLSQRIFLFIPLVIVLTIIPIYLFYCFFEAPFIARKSSSRLRP